MYHFGRRLECRLSWNGIWICYYLLKAPALTSGVQAKAIWICVWMWIMLCRMSFMFVPWKKLALQKNGACISSCAIGKQRLCWGCLLAIVSLCFLVFCDCRCPSVYSAVLHLTSFDARAVSLRSWGRDYQPHFGGQDTVAQLCEREWLTRSDSQSLRNTSLFDS